MQTPTESHDQLQVQAVALGTKIQRLRKALGYTQIEIAEAMQHRGVPWLQQNVVRAEKGSGRLRFDEVCALADVLEVPLDALRDASDSAELIAELKGQVAAIDQAASELDRATQAHYEGRRVLQETLRRLVADDTWRTMPGALLIEADELARTPSARGYVELIESLLVETTPLVTWEGPVTPDRDYDPYDPKRKARDLTPDEFDPEVWA